MTIKKQSKKTSIPSARLYRSPSATFDMGNKSCKGIRTDLDSRMTRNTCPKSCSAPSNIQSAPAEGSNPFMKFTYIFRKCHMSHSKTTGNNPPRPAHETGLLLQFAHGVALWHRLQRGDLCDRRGVICPAAATEPLVWRHLTSGWSEFRVFKSRVSESLEICENGT